MLEFLKILIALEFLLINTLCLVIINKYKAKKQDKLLRFMPYLFTCVAIVVLATFVFFTGWKRRNERAVIFMEYSSYIHNHIGSSTNLSTV